MTRDAKPRKIGKRFYGPNRTLTPTAGAVLDHRNILELVRDPKTRYDSILHWSEEQFTVAPEQLFRGRHFVVSKNSATLRHLPSEPLLYGSTEELFYRFCKFASDCLAVRDDEAALLAYFCFATFFCDSLGSSPCLVLLGKYSLAAISILRFLGCVCRHPILLAESKLHDSLLELQPTRLICQPDPALNRLFAGLQFSGFGISNRGLRQLSGGVAVYIGNSELNSLFSDSALQMPVSPLVRTFTTADEEREVMMINRLQNQLLMYRLHNFAKVKSSQFDALDFSGSTRELGKNLGRCIVDAPDLQARVLDVLGSRDDAEKTELATSIEACVVEALIVACHEQRQSVYVGQVAELANAILRRNEERLQLSAKGVGEKLRQLGFRTTRLDSDGRGIQLLKGQCDQIHRLGRAFGVPTLREGLPACPHCQRPECT